MQPSVWMKYFIFLIKSPIRLTDFECDYNIFKGLEDPRRGGPAAIPRPDYLTGGISSKLIVLFPIFNIFF